MTYRLQRLFVAIVDAVLAFIAFVLGMRVVFQLMQANPETPFVTFINRMSAFLMYPFQNMFPSLRVSEFGSLDMVALITLLAYSLIGYLIITAIRMVMRPTIDDVYHQERHVLH